MNDYEGSLRLFEELDGLADEFIEESMLPDGDLTSPARRKPKGGLWRFLTGGAGVAILCAVVSLGILTALIHVGLSGDGAMGNMSPPQQDGPANNAFPDAVTDEPVTLPKESDRVPVGTRSEDESGLYYVSYGDGTCICMGFLRDEGQTHLAIPTYSPDGDVVVAIYSYAFRNCLSLESVTLPAGLRSFDHKTFPMEAPIYRIHGNILYLGSENNPYMVAVAVGDDRPGATSLHPATRILACHAMTYSVGAYFAQAWADRISPYEEDEVFTLPRGIVHIGEYSLLDVGRDLRFEGYLVAWDALTAGGYKDLIRTPDGHSVTVTCLDGSTASRAHETRRVSLDATAYCTDGILYGGYDTYTKHVNPAFYRWLTDPDAPAEVPEQFITASAVFGDIPRTLTPEELAAVAFTLPVGTEDGTLADLVTAFHQSTAELYRGKTVVVIPLNDVPRVSHTVTDITVTEGHIHVTVAGQGTSSATGSRFLLVPVEGDLQGAEVSYTLLP